MWVNIGDAFEMHNLSWLLVRMGILSNFNIPVLAFILSGRDAAGLSRQRVFETQAVK